MDLTYGERVRRTADGLRRPAYRLRRTWTAYGVRLTSGFTSLWREVPARA